MLIFKLVATPLLMLIVTLAARRFGPVAGGVLMGLPLTTGPISGLLAQAHGADFAREAALASLVGQISTGLFCLAYAVTCRTFGATVSAIVGLSVFALATAGWSLIDWTVLRAIVAFALGFLLIGTLFPRREGIEVARQSPRWDLPVRMIAGTIFVVILSAAGGTLGPTLSGLIAPMPVIALILAICTQVGFGSLAAQALLRGGVIGSPAFGAFFISLVWLLPQMPPVLAYGLASSAAIAAGLIIWCGRRAIGMPRIGSRTPGFDLGGQSPRSKV